MVLYIFFGVLTTAVSYGSYFLARIAVDSVTLCNIFSWCCAVAFAFVTNKVFVFKSKTNTAKELITEVTAFVSARLLSGVVETFIMWLCADRLSEFFCNLFHVSQEINELIFKLFANVIVLIMNYIFSKLVIFRNKGEQTERKEKN